MNGTPSTLHLPRSPVLGWASFAGARHSALPCLLDHPRRQFTTSGRGALFLALEQLGVQPGCQVLVPGHHCPSMVAPIVALGATPVFYALDEFGHAALPLLPPAGARVLIAVHLFGLPQPMAALRAWCNANGTALLEDCAHALFGSSEGRAIGSWGDMAIGSLAKFLPVAEGGCLVDNRVGSAHKPVLLAPAGSARTAQALLDMVEQGAQHNRLHGLNLAVRGALRGLRALRRTRSTAVALPSAKAAGDAGLDADFRVDTVRARSALAAPCRWVANRACHARIVQARRQHYLHYGQALQGRSGMKPLLPLLPEGCAPYMFPLWVQVPDPAFARLRQRGLPLARWDRLWPGLPTLAGDSGRAWSHHVFQLPCHQDLQKGDLEAMVQALLEETAP